MADFTTWDRSTLEQFAREATARLIENSDAIEELREALKFASASLWSYGASVSAKRADAVLTKHESTTKEQ